MQPHTKVDWTVILDAVEWIQGAWPELQKAERDMRDYGSGYIRVTPAGIEHVPLERIRIDMPGKQHD